VTAAPRFKIGDRVIDRDGFPGTIRGITHHDGAHWYDVQLPGGGAVRFDSDLAPAMVTVPELEPYCGSWVVVDHARQEAICEVVLRTTADRLAELAIPGKVDILTAAQWLARVNARLRPATKSAI